MAIKNMKLLLLLVTFSGSIQICFAWTAGLPLAPPLGTSIQHRSTGFASHLATTCSIPTRPLTVPRNNLGSRRLGARHPSVLLRRPKNFNHDATTTCLSIADDSSSSEADNNNNKGGEGLWTRIKGYFLLKEKKNDGLTFKQRLAKMGVATVLSYGMISNLSYAILVALAWYGSSVKTGLSPLTPGQWKNFLAVYGGFWMFNNIIRPLRLGLSIAIAPTLDKLVLFFQNKLKISKPLAITVTVVFVNVIGTTLFMCGGIAGASLLAGVPIFPPK